MNFTQCSKIFSIISFGAILASGCSTGLLQSETTKLDITGKVIDAVTGEGISGATVRISTESTEVDDSGFEQDWTQATTLPDDELTTDHDETGEFAFHDIITRSNSAVVEVTYTPAAEVATKVTTVKTEIADSYYLYRTTVNTHGSTTEFLPIQHKDLGNLGLVEDDGSLTVTVFNATGPISGVTLYLMNTNVEAGKNFVAEAFTNENGVAAFTNLPETNGYTLMNYPFDANGDGLFDYGALTYTNPGGDNTIDLSKLGISSYDQNIALVLPTYGSEFDLNWTNIGNYTGYTTNLLRSNATLSFYFNKPVADDSNLIASCFDQTEASGTIPVTTVVDSTNDTLVMVTPNLLTNGHTYGCSISAATAYGEMFSSPFAAGGDFTFMVTEAENSTFITDFIFNAEASDDASATASGATDADQTDFNGLVDTYTSVTGQFSFTVPSNATFVELFVRNDDVDFGANSFDFSTPYSASTVADVDGNFTYTGSQIDITELPVATTVVNFTVASLQTLLTSPVSATGSTRSIYFILRACNEDYIGIGATDTSDNCTFSNVIQLTDTL